MKSDIDAFENEQNRLAANYAMQKLLERETLLDYDPATNTARRVADVDMILLRATPRPTFTPGPSRPQIAVTVVLALCLGLALGAVAERTWTETNATQVQE